MRAPSRRTGCGRERCHSPPISGLPEIGIINAQVGYSRPACASRTMGRLHCSRPWPVLRDGALILRLPHPSRRAAFGRAPQDEGDRRARLLGTRMRASMAGFVVNNNESTTPGPAVRPDGQTRGLTGCARNRSDIGDPPDKKAARGRACSLLSCASARMALSCKRPALGP